MPHPHPTDRTLAALIDGRLETEAGDAARDHLAHCPRCQLRAGQSAPALGEPLVPALSLPIGPINEEPADSPERGDLWRLAWDETVALAIVWTVEAERVTVLPTIEPAFADEWCLLTQPEDLPGLGPLAVSAAFETAVPWSVLDARVGHLVDTTTLTSLRSAYRRGTDPGALRRGRPVVTAVDDRLEELDCLAETMGELANAVWADDIETTSVQLTFEELASAGLPPNRALAIYRGAAPTQSEAHLVEAATGRRPGRAPVPAELRRAIDRPQRKAVIRARSRRERQTEAEVRLTLASAAQPALSAARGTRGEAPNFESILDQLLGD